MLTSACASGSPGSFKNKNCRAPLHNHWPEVRDGGQEWVSSYQNHLEGHCWAYPRVSASVGLEGAWDHVFLVSSKGLFMLLLEISILITLVISLGEQWRNSQGIRTGELALGNWMLLLVLFHFFFKPLRFHLVLTKHLDEETGGERCRRGIWSWLRVSFPSLPLWKALSLSFLAEKQRC